MRLVQAHARRRSGDSRRTFRFNKSAILCVEMVFSFFSVPASVDKKHCCPRPYAGDASLSGQPRRATLDERRNNYRTLLPKFHVSSNWTSRVHLSSAFHVQSRSYAMVSQTYRCSFRLFGHSAGRRRHPPARHTKRHSIPSTCGTLLLSKHELLCRSKAFQARRFVLGADARRVSNVSDESVGASPPEKKPSTKTDRTVRNAREPSCGPRGRRGRIGRRTGEGRHPTAENSPDPPSGGKPGEGHVTGVVRTSRRVGRGQLLKKKNRSKA